MTTTKIARYNNGGYYVSIYSDGTKIRTQRNNARPVFPESMDIKITNFCNLHNYCRWCHEASNPNGKHADLDKLVAVLSGLPKGVELAIGGGNPLSHPGLESFLEANKNMGLISNITINELHVNQHKAFISNLIAQDLVKGVGVTYSGKQDIQWLEGATNNLVYHVIAGVHDPEVLGNMSKALVLGYKQIRKGATFYSKKVSQNLNKWIWRIRDYLGNNLVSFDNIAIEQLKVKRFLTDEAWESFYMGDDGSFTFYIDAVEQKFAKSSTSLDRFALLNSAEDMFNCVLTEI